LYDEPWQELHCEVETENAGAASNEMAIITVAANTRNDALCSLIFVFKISNDLGLI
jgi:hypothetical protein